MQLLASICSPNPMPLLSNHFELVFGCSDCALDPARSNVGDVDGLLPTAAPGCSDEPAEGVFRGGIFPVALHVSVLVVMSDDGRGDSLPASRSMPPASINDETPVSFGYIRLLTEEVLRQLPCVKGSVDVDSDDVEVGLCRLALSI